MGSSQSIYSHQQEHELMLKQGANKGLITSYNSFYDIPYNADVAKIDASLYLSDGERLVNVSQNQPGNDISLRKSLSKSNPFNLKAISDSVGLALKLPAVITSVQYIDTSLPTNGSGTYQSPKNTLPADFGFGANTAYLIKCGTVINGGRSLNTISNVYFGTYGTGQKPLWVNNLNDQCIDCALATQVTFDGIRFKSTDLRCIKNSSSQANTTSTKIAVINCEFEVTVNSTRVAADTDCNGISLYGADNKVLGCKFDNIATDACWASGNNFEFAFNHVSNVAKDGRVAGDCFQFSSGDNVWIHHNYLDHQGSEGKQAIMGGNSGTGGTIEYNYCIYDMFPESSLSNVILSEVSGIIIRRNIVIGGANGIVAGTLSATIESNYILNGNSRTDALKGKALTYKTGASTVTIQNNTIESFNNQAKTGISSDVYAGAMTSLTVRNNIIKGFATAVSHNASANITFDSNILFDNAVDFDGSIGSIDTNTYNIDPELDSLYVPQQSLVGALGIVGATYDLYGNAYNNVTNQIPIGCVQTDGQTFDSLVKGSFISMLSNL